MTEAKEALIERATLAEQTGRYDDMVLIMKEAVKQGVELTGDERNLLSMAYKHKVGSCRVARRLVLAAEEEAEASTASSEEAAAADDNDELKKLVAKAYREELEAEMHAICNDLLELLEHELIPRTTEHESRVFYMKMVADYYRYRAEVATGEEQIAVIANSGEAYHGAMCVAKESLAPNNTVRLGLALNYSVFYYEILCSPEKARQLANEALHDAISYTNTANEKNNDSELILQLIRDNLHIWDVGEEGVVGGNLVEDTIEDDNEEEDIDP